MGVPPGAHLGDADAISRRQVRTAALMPKLVGYSELGWSLLLIVSLLIPMAAPEVGV